MEPAINKVSAYYLRTPDGTVYGPVDIVTLCIWATDARVIPGCELSEKQDVWFPVEKITELRLNWSVQFSDGAVYGPLNLLAIRVLAEENSIPAGVRLSELGSGRTAVLDDSIMSLMVEEFHQMLAGCGALMSTTLGALQGAHRVALSEVQERSSRLVSVQTSLENAEKDLATSLMVNEALSHQLKEIRTLLQNKETLVRNLESVSAQGKIQAETQAAGLRAKVAALEKELQETQQRADRLSVQMAEAKEGAQKVLLEERAALLKEAQSALQGKETQLRQLESALAEAKMQAGARESELRSMVAIKEKTLREMQQRADFLAAQLVQVQEASQKALLEGRAAALKEAQIALQNKETLIQQLKSTLAHGQIQAETKANELRSKETVLEKSLQEAQQREDLLVAQRLQVQEDYQALLKESARKEKELLEKLAQIERNERKQDGAKQGAVVETEVIQTEVLEAETLGPEESGKWAASSGYGQKTQSAGRQEEQANKSGILNSVEARLQIELRQWEALKREQENQKRTGGKWFGRK